MIKLPTIRRFSRAAVSTIVTASDGQRGVPRSGWPLPLSRGRAGSQFDELAGVGGTQHHPELSRLWQCLRISCRYLGADGGD